jgi:hypothetical protein
LFDASTGSSKKEAEQLAAETAWRAITARYLSADGDGSADPDPSADPAPSADTSS